MRFLSTSLFVHLLVIWLTYNVTPTPFEFLQQNIDLSFLPLPPPPPLPPENRPPPPPEEPPPPPVEEEVHSPSILPAPRPPIKKPLGPPPIPKIQEVKKPPPLEEPPPVKIRTYSKIEDLLKETKPPPKPTKKILLPQKLTEQEIVYLKTHIRKYWKWPENMPLSELEDVYIVVAFSLKETGLFATLPRVIEKSFVSENHQGYLEAFEQSVLRSLLGAAPLPVPRNKYTLWKNMELTFYLQELLP